MTTLTAVNDRTRTASRFAHVVPLAFITYALAFLDRVNYGSAESRMRSALGMSFETSSLLASLFFYGYFLFQIPAAHYAARRSVRWLVFWALLAWGVLSGLTGVIRSVPLLAIDRLMLGAVEGVVLPAMLIFLTRWFTKPERARANALLILANPLTMACASVLCGFLIAYFDVHPFGRLAGWQMMFLVEGLPSIAWAFLWIILAQERPAEAAWLAPDEADAIQFNLDAEQRTMPSMSSYWQAFADYRVMLLALMYFCFSAAAYGFMMWLPQIVEEGSRRGVARAGLLTAVPYVVAMASMMAVSWFSDRSLNRRPYVAGSMFAGCAGFLIASSAGVNHFWIGAAGLLVIGSCLYTPCGPLWAWMSDLLPSNVVGQSMALVNSAGALGGGVGTWAVGVLKGKTHSTSSAFLFQAACFIAAGVLALAVRSKRTTRQGFEVISH